MAPSLSLGAGVDHLTAHSGSTDFNDTEWTVGAGLEFPLLQGGAKFAERRSRAGV